VCSANSVTRRRFDSPQAVVQHLDLSWNGLENQGCAAIASALGENNALLVLDISATRMGEAPCAALAKALANNSTLEMLFVAGNHFGEEGARVLAKALTENRTLRYLGLTARAPSLSDCLHDQPLHPTMATSVVRTAAIPQSTCTHNDGGVRK
jgi:Leucine Rich repeat